jgi:hypothetical protein
MSCEDPLGGVVIERHDAQQGVNLFLGDEMARFVRFDRT